MKRSVKMPNELPKVLKDNVDDDSLSFAIHINGKYAVIEVPGCVDEKTLKVDDPDVQHLIERADTYTEYVPRSGGIRIIGRSFGGRAVDLGTSSDSDQTMAMYRRCDRWVDISGIPILNDDRLRNLDKIMHELMDTWDRHTLDDE